MISKRSCNSRRHLFVPRKRSEALARWREYKLSKLVKTLAPIPISLVSCSVIRQFPVASPVSQGMEYDRNAATLNRLERS